MSIGLVCIISYGNGSPLADRCAGNRRENDCHYGMSLECNYYKPRESVVYSSYDIFGLGWHNPTLCKRKIASTLTFLGGCFAATNI